VLACVLGVKAPEDVPVSEKHRMCFREWQTILPWDLIYALGVVVLIIFLTLIVALIGLL